MFVIGMIVFGVILVLYVINVLATVSNRADEEIRKQNLPKNSDIYN